ncbi:MAG: energy transducer TonB [Verrucomicrobia bacterium]|nr:energy transducer TonB [Verrucomicrobiota bacterium]
MSRTWIIAAVVSLLLHVGFFFGGQLLKPHPIPKLIEQETPTVELIPIPPVEPDKSEDVPDLAEMPSVSDLVPPMQPDLPSIANSPFLQQIQPPSPGMIRPTGIIVIPQGRPGGTGSGLGNIFELANLDQVPEHRLPPAKPFYPPELRRASIEGKVTVGFIIDVSGNVRDPYIVSSTNRDFEKPALDCVLRWKFSPGKKNGVAVNSHVTTLISFTLRQN